MQSHRDHPHRQGRHGTRKPSNLEQLNQSMEKAAAGFPEPLF
jgi:hypothetical protein